MRRIIGALIVVGILTVIPAGVQAQEEGLVAEWHFDEGTGNIAHDSSGNGNDGVIHGATWVDGKFGKALRLDGVDDYVEVPDSAGLGITDAITIEIWMKFPSHTIKEWETIVAKGDSAYRISFSETTTKLHLAFSGLNDFCIYSSKMELQPDTWYQVVGLYDGSSKMQLWINGRLDTEEYTSGSIATNDYPTMVGENAEKTGRGFKGTIDEVCIYNRPLSVEEIKEHYEGKQTVLSLGKSVSPHSIKQGQETTVTLTVENTGTTEITDIEVVDTIPSDLTFVSGETSKTYASLRPKDSREFQYTLQLNEPGTYNLDPATATYADEEGNYHTVTSETAAIEVIPSLITTPTQRPTPSGTSTASVHLYGEKTDVVLGEDVLLKLSAVNIIGNPTMHVQVIIIPPSGWSVTSSEFATSGTGQYTTTYDIEPGVGRDIEVRIVPNQIGDDFEVQGRIIYYFEDDPTKREDHTLTLPIKVRAKAESGVEQRETPSESNGSSTPGFAAVVAGVGVLAVYLWRKRR
ncbi:MAG: LamG-like jellyroll fold domain-containing protein [Methanosarcinales archaeon]